MESREQGSKLTGAQQELEDLGIALGGGKVQGVHVVLRGGTDLHRHAVRVGRGGLRAGQQAKKFAFMSS